MTKHFELHERPLACPFLLITPCPAETGVRACLLGRSLQKSCSLTLLFCPAALGTHPVVLEPTVNPPTVVLIPMLKLQMDHFRCPLLTKKVRAWQCEGFSDLVMDIHQDLSRKNRHRYIYNCLQIDRQILLYISNNANILTCTGVKKPKQ